MTERQAVDPTLLIHEIGAARLDAIYWRSRCAQLEQRIAQIEAERAKAPAAT